MIGFNGLHLYVFDYFCFSRKATSCHVKNYLKIYTFDVSTRLIKNSGVVLAMNESRSRKDFYIGPKVIATIDCTASTVFGTERLQIMCTAVSGQHGNKTFQ